jgi:hypothetical protein
MTDMTKAEIAEMVARAHRDRAKHPDAGLPDPTIRTSTEYWVREEDEEGDVIDAFTCQGTKAEAMAQFARPRVHPEAVSVFVEKVVRRYSEDYRVNQEVYRFQGTTIAERKF